MLTRTSVHWAERGDGGDEKFPGSTVIEGALGPAR